MPRPPSFTSSNSHTNSNSNSNSRNAEYSYHTFTTPSSSSAAGRFTPSEASSFISTPSQDDEDLLLSPTDGYFSSRPSHPTTMFVDTEAANKAAKIDVTAASASSRTPLRSGALRYEGESTPLLDSFLGQAPPPSYLEATTPNRWDGRRSGDEGARLLPGGSQQVESMSRPGGEPLFRYNRRRGWREYFTREKGWKVGVVVVGVLILLVIVGAAMHGVGDENSYTPAPVTPPAQPVMPGEPKPDGPPADGAPGGAPSNPDPPSSLPEESFPIRWPSHCGKEYNSYSEDHNFGSISELNIQEAIRQTQRKSGSISGWLHVVRAPENQAAGTIQARLSYAASKSVDINSIPYAWSETGLTVGDVSTTIDGDSVELAKRECLGISVVVYVASGMELENFYVNSVHLGTQLHTGIDFSITNSTSISLTSGTLDAATLHSRKTQLETISGSISGKYDLLDQLSVFTKSGSVNIYVSPQEAEEGSSEPAFFLARSISGSIRTDFDRKSIPDRDYRVEIETKDGSIDGSLIHGSKTKISSVTGHITADIVPFTSGDAQSTLGTSTTSGATTVTLRGPYGNGGGAVSRLTSSHTAVSGAIDITYPQEWQGHLEGSSLTGQVHLQGKDLELVHEEQDASLGSRVEAKKGKGKSELEFRTVSGACEVKVGKL